MIDTIVPHGATSYTPISVFTQDSFSAWITRQPEHIQKWAKASRFEAKPGEFFCVYTVNGDAECIVVCLSTPVSMWDFSGLPQKLPAGEYGMADDLPDETATALALGWALGSYKFDRYRTLDKKGKQQKATAKLVLPATVDQDDLSRLILATAKVRDLVNTPSSDMGPQELEVLGRDLAQRHGATCTVIVGDELLDKGFPMIHAVGRASVRQPRLIDVSWGRESDPKVTLVGKGVCFDSGGLSIKSFEEMLTMKIDMSGAAHALALGEMIMLAKLAIRLRILVAAVENAISGNAYRPMDILTSRKGLTVEIGSTDAEGRLILADALTEADESHPDVIVDFATLTGFEAGGGVMAAFYTNDENAAQQLANLSHALEDPIWRMPLTPLIKHRIKGKFADLTNTGSIYKGSTIRGASFLSHFVDHAKTWIHVDLSDGNEDDRPGRPVGGEAYGLRAIYSWLRSRYGINHPMKV